MATQAQVKDFIAKVAPIAQEKVRGRDKWSLPSVCIAQCCCESAYGTQEKMIKANAILGIKVGSSKVHFGNAWHDKAYNTKTKECYDGKTYTAITDMFRAYDSIDDAIEDYYDMLANCSRYKDCINQPDAKSCITAIKNGGYATDPSYITTIMSIINKNNLTQYDSVVTEKNVSSKGKVNSMSVLVGGARSNENGGINGGAPGDQTGGEVATQAWYLHSKGWVVIRAKYATVREKIAECMEMACANDNIGYCQDHRLTGFNEAEKHNFDVSKITIKVEIDCSELVRVCVYYAGIKVADFNTASELATFKATGMFDILTDDKYCKKQDNLLRGDILVTKTKGHTVVVLTNGSQAQSQTSGTVASGTSYKVGDVVLFIGTKHYTSANSTSPKTCKSGEAKVTSISVGSAHPYHLIHTDSTSNVYGWVDAADIGGTAAISTSGTETHTVVKGDTLSAIAGKNGTTVAKIVEANKSKYPKIAANYIVVGWTLSIP